MERQRRTGSVPILQTSATRGKGTIKCSPRSYVLLSLSSKRDRERATYGLKETALAKCYVEVLGLDPKTEAGHRLIHWKQPRPGDVSTKCLVFTIGNC